MIYTWALELARFGIPSLEGFVGMYALGPSGVAALAAEVAVIRRMAPANRWRRRMTRFLSQRVGATGGYPAG